MREQNVELHGRVLASVTAVYCTRVMVCKALDYNFVDCNSAPTYLSLTLRTVRVKTIDTFTLEGVAISSVSRNASVFT